MSTTFERKPFASALIVALALISSSSFAETPESNTTLEAVLGEADNPTDKTIGKVVSSSSVDWNKDWAKKYGNEAAKKLTITGNGSTTTFGVEKNGSLTNNLETIELTSVQMSVNEGCVFYKHF